MSGSPSSNSPICPTRPRHREAKSALAGIPALKTEDRFASWNNLRRNSPGAGRQRLARHHLAEEVWWYERTFDRTENCSATVRRRVTLAADRQSGPLLLKSQRSATTGDPAAHHPRGECYFSIGMSEPTRFDLASGGGPRAELVPGGFRVNNGPR